VRPVPVAGDNVDPTIGVRIEQRHLAIKQSTHQAISQSSN
jgi:hypothetical protein